MAATAVTQSFYDLTGIRLSNTSFLNMFNILKDDDGIIFLNIFRAYEIDPSIFADVLYYNTYEVDNDDWIELISYVTYNLVDLWWALCLMNNIRNPFEDFNVGTNLKILKSDYIPQLIKELQSISEK
jgi:hypothetical protein